MGLEEILKQVEETGKEKAADIRKATVEEVEAKMEEASKESKDLVSQIKSETSKRIEQLKQQEIPAAELEVKRNLLEMQKDLLSQTKTKVMDKLDDLSPKELEKIYSNLLKYFFRAKMLDVSAFALNKSKTVCISVTAFLLRPLS